MSEIELSLNSGSNLISDNTLNIQSSEIDNLNKYNEENKISWKNCLFNGNFMPAIIMLENKKINVNDIIQPETGNTLLHIASIFGYYNVIRLLIEKYNANINQQNYYGQTPLHIICNNNESNLYIFSYLINNEKIILDVIDNEYFSPLIYCIINKFNIEFLYYVTLPSTNLFLLDRFKNSILYFAIINENKYVVKFLLNNFKEQIDINQKYYNDTCLLSDILITNKNNDIAKFLMKYFHNDINLDSIYTCKKHIKSFVYYNRFVYEIINTTYFYKINGFFQFFKGIFRFSISNKKTSNYRLFTEKMPNDNISYYYKIYNIYFMFIDLFLPNYNNINKSILYIIYLIFLFKLVPININEKEIIKFFFNFFVSFFGFILMFNLPYKKTLVLEKNLLSTIRRNFQENKPLNLPPLENTCPICLYIIDNNKIIHCNTCNKCVENFYFHSKLFNVCFKKDNIKYYIIYKISIINYYYYLIKNIYINFKIKYIPLLLYLLIIITIHLGHCFSILCCILFDINYKNLFRYHKTPIGTKQERKNKLIYEIPTYNLINFKMMIKNLFNFLFC